MRDFFGREIDYMRVSITDRCNSRCVYCKPEGIALLPRENILRYEEILKICGIAAGLGIKNFKVTGGEPLVRKGCIDFLRELKSVKGVENVSLTTNGILLEPFINEISEMKLGLNISLDSLNSDTYKRVTNCDNFAAVWRSLEKAIKAGLRVKINFVPIRGINDSEILSVARLAEEKPVDVRFIELMPVGETIFSTAPSARSPHFIGEILKKISENFPDLREDTQKRGFGPARYFKNDKMLGSIGIIGAMGNCFCDSCNRVRLTAEGFLKLCLFHDAGIDLKKMLRSGASDEEIKTAFSKTIYNKPEQHFFKNIKNMSRIGG